VSGGQADFGSNEVHRHAPRHDTPPAADAITAQALRGIFTPGKTQAPPADTRRKTPREKNAGQIAVGSRWPSRRVGACRSGSVVLEQYLPASWPVGGRTVRTTAPRR